jgi:hypothetical protein
MQQMTGILSKRYQEIALRSRLGVKANWFKPLNDEDLGKLGIKAD